MEKSVRDKIEDCLQEGVLRTPLIYMRYDDDSFFIDNTVCHCVDDGLVRDRVLSNMHHVFMDLNRGCEVWRTL